MQVRRTRTWILGTLLFVLPVSTAAAQDVEIDDGAVDLVAEYFERLERLGFAGAVLVSQSGHPLLAEGYGLADREEGIPWTPGTVSTIGSISKQFTAAAILRLQEDGELSVHDSLTRFFHDVPADKQDVTIHQLLTHSSGIVNLAGFGDWDPITRDEFVQNVLKQPLSFEPGEGYEYSNAGYSLLGAIIERLTGESYEHFVRRHLLEPVGLYETGYTLPNWYEGRLASAYVRGERWGTVLERPMAEDGPYWVLRANGGIHSTSYDMLRWAQALMNGLVLSEQSLAQYWAPHVAEGGGDSFYGYGWGIEDFHGLKVLTHNGYNGFFYVDIALVPEHQIVVFLQTNIVADLPMIRSVLQSIGAALMGGAPMPNIPDLAQVEPDRLELLTGSYVLERGGRCEIEVDDQGLRIVPQDPEAYARLLSTRPVDLDRSLRLSTHTDDFVSAYLRGDWGPMWNAAQGAVSLETLRQRGASRLRALEERYGALRGHRVIGTVFRGDRDLTLVRLQFERGSVERTYIWAPEEHARLEGMSRRGVAAALQVIPQKDGSFVIWEPRSGASRPIEFESGKKVSFRLGETVIGHLRQ